MWKLASKKGMFIHGIGISFPLFLQLLHCFLNLFELELKIWIQKRTVIVSVVVVAVAINMTSWSGDSSLVSVDCVTSSKTNYLVSDLNTMFSWVSQ
jgi:hypothetical protein